MDYEEFLQGLEPVILGLDRSSTHLDRRAYWRLADNAKRIISSRYALIDSEKSYFDVEATFRIVIQWAEDDGPVTQALNIECVFWGHFHATAPVRKEYATRFAEGESWFLFWPFFRQFVADASARMAIPPVSVPLGMGPGERQYGIKPPEKKRIGSSSTSKKSPKRRASPS